MGKGSLVTKQLSATPFLSHASGFVVVFFCRWLRVVPPIGPGPARVFAGDNRPAGLRFCSCNVSSFSGHPGPHLVDSWFWILLSGTLLAASSLLFFQFLRKRRYLRWGPVSWWVGRIVLGLLLVVALLVEHFVPRSLGVPTSGLPAPCLRLSCSYVITAALRHLPAETSPHALAFIPSPQQLLPAVLFLVALVWFRRRLQIEDSAFDRALYSAAWMNVAAQLAASQSARLLDSPRFSRKPSRSPATRSPSVAHCSTMQDCSNKSSISRSAIRSPGWPTTAVC